jgi:hypothetical protein
MKEDDGAHHSWFSSPNIAKTDYSIARYIEAIRHERARIEVIGRPKERP